MPALPMSGSSDVLSQVQLAKELAVASRDVSPTSFSLEFAVDALQKALPSHMHILAEKDTRTTIDRIRSLIVEKLELKESLDSWVKEIETSNKVFQDDNCKASSGMPNLASKPQLQNLVKTLGIGTTVYKGLNKDDDAEFCSELQTRVFDFIEKSTGERHTTLPTEEEIGAIIKKIEASKELAWLDSSNIISGRPKRRAAASAALSIKADIQKELEKEAARGVSTHESSSNKRANTGIDKAESQKVDDESDDSSDDSDTSKEGNSDSSSSSSESSGSEDNSSDKEEEKGEHSPTTEE